MKKIVLTTCLLIGLISLGFAQEFKLSKTKGKLIIKEVDRVNIEGHAGTEIIFEGEFQKKHDGRAKGLRSINGMGVNDNTGIGLSVADKGNEVIVGQISSNSKTRYTIKVPKGVTVYYEHTSYHGKEVNIENLESEVEVSVHYNAVNLHNVTGPMAIKSVYGHIEADFERLNQEGSISLHSVYKFVDVTIPASAKANVSMKTSYGEMFTDMDIELPATSGGMKRYNLKKVEGTLNGGGVDLVLRSPYKNIYLRKKKS